MFDLLARLFVRDYKNVNDPTVRRAYGMLVSIVGIVLNFILAAGKLVVGMLSGSLSIEADAVNNLSDAGASLVALICFRISAKPADRHHPFGHARIEYVASMIVSFLILLVGFELISESINGFFQDQADRDATSVAIYVILGISIACKLFLAYYYKHVGDKINSSVVSASATDSLMDAASTAAVLISGIIIRFTGLWVIDSIVGILVSIMIFVAGLRILNETKNSLLGEPPLGEVIESIKLIVAKHECVVGMHDLLVHNYGPNHYIASFHAEVNGEDDVYMLHDAIDNLEREIYQELGILCTVHMDPIEANNEEVVKLRSMTAAVVSEIYLGANIHDFRMVTGPTHTNLIFDISAPFEVRDSDEDIVKRVGEHIHSMDSRYFTVITVDRE